MKDSFDDSFSRKRKLVNEDRTRTNLRKLWNNDNGEISSAGFHLEDHGVVNNEKSFETCELYVGSLPENSAKAKELPQFLTSAMRRTGMVGEDESPIIHCKFFEDYAFLEFDCKENVEHALQFNNILFHGSHLQLRRSIKKDSYPSNKENQLDASSDSDSSRKRALGSTSDAKRNRALELYIGNLPKTLKNSARDLHQFLLRSMIERKMIGREDNPIVQCHMHESYAFVSFVNRDYVNIAKKLNGISLHGNSLPIMYEYNVETRKYRELFIGNPPPDASPDDLKEFLGGTLRKLCMSYSGEYNPILQVKMCRGYAFAECITSEDAANLMNLCGIMFNNHKLQIERSNNFENGYQISYYTWSDILDLHRSGELKVMTAGIPASSVIVLFNMASLEDLADPKQFLEIIQDARIECSKFGEVQSVVVPRNTAAVKTTVDLVIDSVEMAQSDVCKVFVEMKNIPQATNALLGLKGRRFDNRVIDVKYYPHNLFALSDFSYVPPPLILTQSDGLVVLNRILQKTALDKIKESVENQLNPENDL